MALRGEGHGPETPPPDGQCPPTAQAPPPGRRKARSPESTPMRGGPPPAATNGEGPGGGHTTRQGWGLGYGLAAQPNDLSDLRGVTFVLPAPHSAPDFCRR